MSQLLAKMFHNVVAAKNKAGFMPAFFVLLDYVMDHLRQQLSHWQSQVAADANDATAWFNLGWWSNKAGLYTQAVKAYEGSISLGINEPEEAMSNVASVYSERLANTSKPVYCHGCVGFARAARRSDSP